jgi:hypothetical protein
MQSFECQRKNILFYTKANQSFAGQVKIQAEVNLIFRSLPCFLLVHLKYYMTGFIVFQIPGVDYASRCVARSLCFVKRPHSVVLLFTGLL